METGIFHFVLSQINYQQALPFKMLSCTSSSLYQIRSIKSLRTVRREEAEERGLPSRPASTPDSVSSLGWGPSPSHQLSGRPSSPLWLHLSRPQPQRFLLCALLQTNAVPLAQVSHLKVSIFMGQAATPAALLGAATAH